MIEHRAKWKGKSQEHRQLSPPTQCKFVFQLTFMISPFKSSLCFNLIIIFKIEKFYSNLSLLRNSIIRKILKKKKYLFYYVISLWIKKRSDTKRITFAIFIQYNNKYIYFFLHVKKFKIIGGRIVFYMLRNTVEIHCEWYHWPL